MIGGAKGIGIGIDFGIPNQYCRATSKPYIEKDVLDSLRVVASAYGKSNNDADRSIVKNLVDPDNPFVISNAAYEGMSGHNGYPVVFGANKTWANESNGYVTSITSNTIHITNVLKAGLSLLYSYVKFNGKLQNIKEIPPFKIEIKGLEGKSKFIYKYLATSNATKETNLYLENGTHELPKSFLPTEALINDTAVGFSISNIEEGVTNFLSDITIKVLPEYEGAFVTDGINDLITSTKTVQEMLGGSNELTIVSMVHQVKDSANNVSFTNYIRGSANGYFRNIVNNYDKTGIYGYTSSDLKGLSVVNNILGDKNDYTSNGDNRDSIINGNFSVQGYSYNDGNNTGDFSSVAWYWTIIANKVLTTDQINQVIAYFNLDRTLNPDILCNTIKQGITNENHAEFGDKLIDFSGNGRDIQLNNLAWKGNSGIGNYPVIFGTNETWEQINNVDYISDYTSSVIHVSKVKKEGKGLFFTYIKTNGIVRKVNEIPSFTINIKGLEGNSKLWYRYLEKEDSNNIKILELGNGTYELPKSFPTTDALLSGPADLWIGFSITAIQSGITQFDCNITIEVIPSNAGALCLDGINDFGKVTGMPIYKDYTFIIDRQIISIGDTAGVVASKSEDSTDVNKQGAFLFEYLSAPNNINAWSFYKDNGKVANTDFTRGISYQSTYSYNGKDLTIGTSKDSDKLCLGTIRDNDSRFFNGAIYSLMSFPYSMSEFLIERQLKKHKLGTLYPDMVEFRPIVKSNVNWDTIEIWQGDKSLYRPAVNDDKTGIYLKKNSTIGIYVKPNVGQKVSEIVCNGVSYTDLKINSNGFYYKVVPITKSPQKINVAIEQDENYVKFEPVITSNVEYNKLDFYLNNYQKRINVGDYIPKDAYVRANFYLKNNVDELTVFTFNGVNIDYKRSVVDDTAFNIGAIYNYDSPQEVNITVDEYIRYEDIVQPYPVLLRFNDENGNEVSWGGKFRVGSTITRIGSFYENNLIDGLYIVRNPKLNGNNLNTPTHVVEKSMVFTCDTEYLLDNNEPKCILSPSRLRMPNSSYKILGYIPDISGHGNHGVIHNSAYTEGSGVNEDGSWQFDGVDDFINIPTLSSGGKQVLMKVNWNTINSIIYDQRGSGGFAIYCSDYNNPSESITVPAYKGRNAAGTTYIDGIRNEYIIASQLRNVTHNIVEILDTSYAAGNINPIIGKSYMNSNYGSLALYDFMLFDNISTDDKIKQLNEYVGIEAKVELPPYYWDAYGKTNLDADKATIQQRGVAVGDFDLTNNNFAYDNMSGYGGYSFKSFNDSQDWNIRGDGTGVEIVSRDGYSITIKKLIQNLDWQISNNEYRYPTILDKELPFKCISNKKVGLIWQLKYKTEGATSDTNVTLINQQLTPNVPLEINLPYKTQDELTELGAVSTSVYYLLYFSNTTLEIGEEYTVEMLPLYPNGLVYDGVEDFSVNKNIPIIDDFTVIAKRTWLEENISDKPFIIKGDTLYPDGNQNAFLFEYGKLSTYSFGQNNKYDESVVPSLISWATPTSYNGTTSLVKGSAIDTVGIDIAHATKMVLYKLILYPKTISLLEINFLKNLMEKDEIIDLTNPIFIQ